MMGSVMDDRKVEEKWKFSARSPTSLSLVSYTNLHKIRSRQPRDLKLGVMIAYMEFHEILDFQISTT